MSGQSGDDTYRWECVCGWSIERKKRASDLPPENNKRLARSVAEIHETRPRFGAFGDETHAVSRTETEGENHV
ncbi:hypothetical protein SAMN05216226_104221 [Halovenus aranensis]|uniref:Uncharacterized protein n=1 Tax=Halovenus aranensis TaxID=890420 RepID=A0A1G8UF12_9EURY|nr:hypothetical protein SAMN05216226_104221 [Halovenus aranensis]